LYSNSLHILVREGTSQCEGTLGGHSSVCVREEVLLSSALTLLLDLAVGHLHGRWCLREGIEHGEAAISQA
jgi:hypothetical protein